MWSQEILGYIWIKSVKRIPRQGQRNNSTYIFNPLAKSLTGRQKAFGSSFSISKGSLVKKLSKRRASSLWLTHHGHLFHFFLLSWNSKLTYEFVMSHMFFLIHPTSLSINLNISFWFISKIESAHSIILVFHNALHVLWCEVLYLLNVYAAI